MAKPRDSQRSAVYKWERAVVKKFNLDASLNLSECQAYTNWVWAKWYKSQPPLIKDGRGRRSACHYYDWRIGRSVIKLPKPARSHWYILHEIAHAMLWSKKNGEPPHGKMFARLLLDLFCSEFKLPLAEVKRIGIQQSPRRVKFSPLSKMGHVHSRYRK